MTIHKHDPGTFWDSPGRVWSLPELAQFYAASFALILARLERAWHSLSVAMIPIKHPPEWSLETAWKEVDEVLEHTHGVLVEHGFPNRLLSQLDRAKTRCQGGRTVAHAPLAVVALQDMAASIAEEMSSRAYWMIEPTETSNFIKPLDRFGLAAEKFPKALDSMQSASRCYAFGEWDAAVFHSMRVLEQGLRWLGAQINAGPFPLTLSKPIELENWESIINNIQARIDEELGNPKAGQPPRPPKTTERDALLHFYSRAAAEMRYFKDAWRNHIMHDRNHPHSLATAGEVVNHVASFMNVLAERA